MPTNKLGSSPLKVPKASSLPCPLPRSLLVVVPPSAPNIITTEKDKTALSSDLETSLDPKCTCWHSLTALSMSTTACQPHLRVTALEKQGKHFSASHLPFFFFVLSKAISGHLAFTSLFIYNRGKKTNPVQGRENIWNEFHRGFLLCPWLRPRRMLGWDDVNARYY